MPINTGKVFNTPKVKDHDIHFNEPLNFRVLCTRGASQNVCNGICPMKAHIQCYPFQFIKKWFLALCNEKYISKTLYDCIHSTNI